MSVKVPTKIKKNRMKYCGDERVGLSWYRPTRANVLTQQKKIWQWSQSVILDWGRKKEKRKKEIDVEDNMQ